MVIPENSPNGIGASNQRFLDMNQPGYAINQENFSLKDPQL
jgi:hypothetical protein